MGGSSSKVARGAQAAKRKLPTTVSSSSTLNQRSPVPPTSTSPSPTEAHPTSTNNATVNSQSQPGLHPGPNVHPDPSTPSSQPSSDRNQFIDLDARDPTFSSNLRSIGPVQPTPTASNSSAFVPTSSAPDTYQNSRQGTGQVFPDARMNPALAVLKARETISRRVEQEQEEMGRKGFLGRTIVDPATLGAIVRAREGKQISDEDVEKRWRLKKGLLQEKLGEKGRVWGSVS